MLVSTIVTTMTLGYTRNLFRLALTVIVLTFFQSSAAQAQDPKLEIFVFATTIQLRSELVLLERGKDLGELYFFSGKKVELKKMAAVEPVGIIRESNPVTNAEAIYHREGDLLRIVEIRLPEITLRKAGAKE